MWKESVEKKSLIHSVKQALNDFFKGDIEEIKETEEENLSVSVEPVLESTDLFSLNPSGTIISEQPLKVPSLQLPSSSSSKEIEASQNDLMCGDSGPPTPIPFPDLFYSVSPSPPSLQAISPPKKSHLVQTPKSFLHLPRPSSPTNREKAREMGYMSTKEHQINPRLRCFFDTFGSTSPQRKKKVDPKCVTMFCKKEFIDKAFRTGFKFDSGRNSPLREKGTKTVSRSPTNPKNSSAHLLALKDFNKENTCTVQPGVLRPRPVEDFHRSISPLVPPVPDLLRFPISHSFKKNFYLK